MTLNPNDCFLISEVHNYGGFFGGDTITFDAAPLNKPTEHQTIVIDGKDFSNVANRHNILAGMVLELHMTGERVDVARLLAAQSYDELRTALGVPELPAKLDAPLKLSGRCSQCQRWVTADLLTSASCELCSHSK